MSRARASATRPADADRRGDRRLEALRRRPSRSTTLASACVPGESHALVGRNGAGKSTLVGILTGLACARHRRSALRRRAGAAALRPRGVAAERRLRLPALDHHSRPDGRREPLRQPPADAARMDQLGARSAARRAWCSTAGTSPSRGHARRRPPGRGPPARRDRARPVLRRPLHHPRRADRAARRRGDQAPVRPHPRAAGAGRHLPLHLAPPPGGLRDLPGGDRAPRCAPHRHRAGRRAAEGQADRGDDRRAASTSHVADAAGRTIPADAPVALEVDDLGGEDFRDVSFTVRAGEVVGLSGATSSGRIGVAEAVAGLGASPPARSRSTAAPCRRRRAGGARPRRRLRAEEPPQAGPRPLACRSATTPR